MPICESICPVCHMKSADSPLLLSPLSLFRFFLLPSFISVRGLHHGTVTPCFKVHYINLSSKSHPLLGSSHSAPTQSLHTCARRLKKNDIFDLVKVAICRILLRHMSWPKLAIDVVKEQFANFLVSKIQGRPPKIILLKFIISAWGSRINVSWVKQNHFHSPWMNPGNKHLCLIYLRVVLNVVKINSCRWKLRAKQWMETGWN